MSDDEDELQMDFSLDQSGGDAHELMGEVILEQGSMADQMYFVCHGKVEELTNLEENETEESLLDLQTYNSVGEISILCNIPDPYTVQVSELSRLL
ncbi:hypothetical protein CQW23_12137 [Capsicum baccatum]|uniref:Potassium channel n=1 Tax=Capsicum baccatum TaxID=33114 RepID=A0A2G2WRW2_CAPBA|nr:hypothetical protein CQW23_12137 [Capsicum baccatum]